MEIPHCGPESAARARDVTCRAQLAGGPDLWATSMATVYGDCMELMPRTDNATHLDLPGANDRGAGSVGERTSLWRNVHGNSVRRLYENDDAH